MQISLSNAANIYQRYQDTPALERSPQNSSSQGGIDTQENPEDTVSLSRRSPGPFQGQEPPSQTETTSSSPSSSQSESLELTAEEVQELQKLKMRDAEVRAHEQAHLASAGQYAAGGPTFSYQTGPDGKRYAVGGEVPIDISKESSPEATIAKMQTVRRAALAPASPSPADRQIAAQAAATEAQAVIEKQRGEQSANEGSTSPDTAAAPTQPIDNQPSSQESVTPRQRAMMIAAYETYASLA